MDVFVIAFLVGAMAAMVGYLYVQKRKQDEVAKAEIDKAWKREQNRKRRADKKAQQMLTEQMVDEDFQQQSSSEHQANAAWIKPEWTQQ